MKVIRAQRKTPLIRAPMKSGVGFQWLEGEEGGEEEEEEEEEEETVQIVDSRNETTIKIISEQFSY